MFKITLSPQAASTSTVISVEGTTLTYNEVEYDFSTLEIGSQVEAEYPAQGTIQNIDGVINITLLYQYNSSLAESSQSTDADDYIVTLSEGELVSPIIWKALNV